VYQEVKSVSADGRFLVRTDAWEARASLWVESPTIFSTEATEPLLQFSSELWSLDKAEWLSNETVELTVRKFPGNHKPSQIVITINCNERTATLGSSGSVALSELEGLLEKQLSWS
jgi:hypothetical protein